MRARRFLLAAASVVLISWLFYAFAGRMVAAELSKYFGEALLRLGQGKFNDAQVFVHNRLFEGLWLVTVGVGVGACLYLLDRFLAKRGSRNRWIFEASLGFVLLNLWLGLASNTCLFWALMYTGQSNHNLVQFHFKRLLLRENPARPKAVLLGSSQTRAQIDEMLLNQILDERLSTTELHYPGARAYDLLLTMRRLARERPDYVVCYLSESYFFTGVGSEGLPCFLRLSDLADSRQFEAYPVASAKGFGYGLLGDVLPFFRYRDVLAARIFGISFTGLAQQQYLTRLEPDLNRRAQQTAGTYRLDEDSEFQMSALEEFITEAQRSNTKVVLCVGQLNPVLAQTLASDLRTRMLSFLRSLPHKHPNLKLLEEDVLPAQSAEEYDDLTHAKRSAQERFTRRLAGLLEKMLASQSVKR